MANQPQGQPFPAPGSIWRHYNGLEFKVLFITASNADHPEYPAHVVYKGLHNGKKWTRPLHDWHRSMTFESEGSATYSEEEDVDELISDLRMEASDAASYAQGGGHSELMFEAASTLERLVAEKQAVSAGINARSLEQLWHLLGARTQTAAVLRLRKLQRPSPFLRACMRVERAVGGVVGAAYRLLKAIADGWMRI